MYEIQHKYLENQILIERLHPHNDKVDEDDKMYIELSKRQAKKRREQQIQNLIEEKAKETPKKDFDGEDFKALSKAVHMHNKFINNGGTMNVFIGDANSNTEIKEQLKQLETAKAELARIKESPEVKMIEAAHEDDVDEHAED